MESGLEWLHQLPQHVLSLPAVWVYVVCGALVFAEDAIFVGFAIPGETAAVLAGVSSSVGHASLAVAITVVVLAAVVGDTVGFEVGRHLFGPKLLDSPRLRKHRGRIESGRELLRRRGGMAVFLGRFTAFFRAMMPALAGASRMRYPVFARWNMAGGLVWGVAFVALGDLAGASYRRVEKQAGAGIAITLAVVVVTALVAWHLRRRHAGA